MYRLVIDFSLFSNFSFERDLFAKHFKATISTRVSLLFFHSRGQFVKGEEGEGGGGWSKRGKKSNRWEEREERIQRKYV